MIRLSNGRELEYVVASGALGYFGNGWVYDWPFLLAGKVSKRLPHIDSSLFTIVAKTVTLSGREGNFRWWAPWKTIKFLDADGNAGLKGFLHCRGTVNAYGLRNPGVAWWAVNCKTKGCSVIVSLFSDAINPEKKLVQMVDVVKETGVRVVAIEINASCPNADREVLTNTAKIIKNCEAVNRAARLPLILKLSVAHDTAEILPRIQGLVEAISINSVPWRMLFPDKKSPMACYGGGGVSGNLARGVTWSFANYLIKSTDIPVIVPSIWDEGDIRRAREMGAGAVSFGSLFLRHPCRATKLVRGDIARAKG